MDQNPLPAPFTRWAPAVCLTLQRAGYCSNYRLYRTLRYVALSRLSRMASRGRLSYGARRHHERRALFPACVNTPNDRTTLFFVDAADIGTSRRRSRNAHRDGMGPAMATKVVGVSTRTAERYFRLVAADQIPRGARRYPRAGPRHHGPDWIGNSANCLIGGRNCRSSS